MPSPHTPPPRLARRLVGLVLSLITLSIFSVAIPATVAAPLTQPIPQTAPTNLYPATTPPTPSPTTLTTPAPTATAPTSPAQPNGNFGLAAGSSLTDLSPSDLNHELTDISSLGATWVRYDIAWPAVQPDDAAHYDWTATDRVATAIAAHHLTPLAILDYTPAWARQAACATNPMCAPADPAAYARFAAAATSRYASQGLHTWEIWNEPNAAATFAPAADPAAYAQLLRAAFTAIKRTDPTATVLTGGLAPAGSTDGNLSPTDFLTQLYATGAAGSFDAVADHPYTYPAPASYPNPYNAWGQLTTLHDLMTAHGDGAKRLWITEYGAPTGGPGPTDHLDDYLDNFDTAHVDEALQAAMVTDAIAQYRTLSWAGPFLWYTYQDAGTTSDTNENFFGLLRADGSHKPAYAAFEQAIKP